MNTLAFSGGVGGAVLASGSADGVIYLWILANSVGLSGRVWQQWGTLWGHDGPVRVVTFDPVDRTLASGGQDTMVRTWNVATGSLLNTFRGHDSPINNVSFSPSAS